MGWFDQETKDGDTATVTAPQTQQQRAMPSPTGSRGDGSTIGQRVQINGTVVSDEDLEIVGKVEGTIHTRKGLRVAREAEVKAVIHGTEVLVEGTVNGDINASEKLVLGATAMLTGNIKTPSLQIRDGAFFRGQVTMQQPDRVVDKPKKKAQVQSPQRPATASAGPNGSSAPAKTDGDDGKEAAPAAKPTDTAAKRVGVTSA